MQRAVESLTLFSEFLARQLRLLRQMKGLSDELQGGLSGLYSRFRTSVGGVRILSAVVESLQAKMRQKLLRPRLLCRSIQWQNQSQTWLQAPLIIRHHSPTRHKDQGSTRLLWQNFTPTKILYNNRM